MLYLLCLLDATRWSVNIALFGCGLCLEKSLVSSLLLVNYSIVIFLVKGVTGS